MRSLDRLNAAAAMMKKTVDGNPGTITPMAPTATHTSPATTHSPRTSGLRATLEWLGAAESPESAGELNEVTDGQVAQQPDHRDVHRAHRPLQPMVSPPEPPNAQSVEHDGH